MPDVKDRYIYQVEIDLTDVEGEVERLRQILGKAITVTPSGSDVKAMTEPARETAEQFERIAKIDTGKTTDALRADLQAATKEAENLEDRLQKLSFAGGFTGAPISNSIRDAYERIERELGRETANAMRASGRVPSIGDLGAQFTSSKTESLATGDVLGNVGEATQQVMREVQEKSRRTAEEIREEFAITGELYEAQIRQAQINKEIISREAREIEDAQAEIRKQGEGQDPKLVADAVGGLDEAWEDAQREIARLAKEEADLAQSLEELRRRQRQELERAQQQADRLAARQRGEIAPAVGTTGAGAGVTRTQQTAISVTKRSVDNAKELAEALKESAEATRRIAEFNARGIGKEQRQAELDAIRERLKLEQQSAVATEKAVAAERQAAAQRKRAEDTVTDNKKTESRLRIEQAKQENRLELENARRTTKQLAEEERRRTQAEASERKRRESSARRGPAGTGGRGLQNLARGGLAAVGVYSLDQVIRQFYSEGKTGAQQARVAETFEFLAERAGVSSQKMIKAINEASNGTIDDMTAIQLSAQLLSQRFATTATDITGDTQTLVAASRRYAQIYTDESGNFLNTQEVFSRLIKFIREGNKELVDQFGLSNQAIADTLGVTKEGLASAEGAALRYKGVVKLLTADIARLGEAEGGYADQIESAEARITNARNRLREALAPTSATLAEGAAGSVERSILAFGGGDLDLIISQLDELSTSQDNWINSLTRSDAAIEEQQSRFEALQETLIDANEAVDAGTPGAEEYAATLEQLARVVVANNIVSDQQAASIYAVAEALQIATFDAQVYGGAIAAANAASASFTPYNPLRDIYSGQDPVDLWVSTIETQEERDNNYYALQVKRLDEQRKEEERIAKQAERDAKRVAKEWENAAKATAKAFEAELRGVAGLFGTSDVTEEDLKLAELGLYQDKPDEYLRRLREEVRDGKDIYEGVSIEDAAARIGVDAAQSADAILALFEQAWADSSLFAGGENLDLINREAVERELKRIEESKAGQQAILEYFGISTAQTGTAAVASAAGAAIMTELGAGTGVTLGAGTEAEAGTVRAAEIEGGTLTIQQIQADPETIQAFINSLSVTIANTGSQVGIGQTIRADVLAGFAGVGTTTPGELSPMVSFVQALRRELDAGDSAAEIVAQATGIGRQLQNYIGAGLIDLTEQPTMAAVFAEQLKISFLAKGTSDQLADIGGSLKGAIKMAWDNPGTTPDFASSLANTLTTQLYREETVARVQAIGTIIVTMIYVGYQAGASEFDWIGPVISAAATQAEETTADATASAFESF